MNYKLKIELVDGKLIEPKGIYFTVIIPANITFLQLHKIIMAATNYQDYHEWRFVFKNDFEVKTIRDYDIDSRENPYNPNHKFPDLLEAKDTQIKQLFAEYKKVKYTYDFGDDNDFEIKLLKVYEDELVNGVLEFNGTFPPEDIGGINGYGEFLHILQKGSKATDDEKDFARYYKELGYKKFNITKANKLINEIVKTDYNNQWKFYNLCRGIDF